MSEIIETNSGIAFKKNPLLYMLLLYTIFGIFAAFAFLWDLNPRADRVFSSFNTYFMIVWVIGFLFCFNGAVRGFPRYFGKLSAIDADREGLIVRCYPDYPTLTVRWSNIKRAIRMDNLVFVEIRDESEIFEGYNIIDKAVVRYGGFFTGTRLLRNDYTGVKNGPFAVEIRVNLLEATPDEVVAFINKNLAKYKI